VDLDEALAAVLSEPLRNAPRLRYAEIVKGTRAELIRTQIDHARLLSASTPNPLTGTLRKKAQKLVDAEGRDWAGLVVTEIASKWEFRRGFVERVTVDARAFMARGDELFAHAPVRLVALENVQAVDLDRLFANPLLERLGGLDLSKQKIGDAGAKALARSPRLGQLRWLGLHSCAIGLEGAEALCASTLLPNLLHVEFGGNPVEITPTPGGIEQDGSIMGWDLSPEAVALAKKHGVRAWQKGRVENILQLPVDLDWVQPPA
jgi:hypothetical protein